MNNLLRKTGAGQAALPESSAERKGASEHEVLFEYEAILDNASVGIAFTEDRAFQHANRAFEESLAWPLPAAEVGLRAPLPRGWR